MASILSGGRWKMSRSLVPAISHWTIDKGYVIHRMTGTDAGSEVTRLFGLIELVEVNPRTPPNKRRELIEALHARILSAMIPTSSE